MDQNSALKKEAGIAERKLLARNERIQNLEALLQDADRRLAIQNQKFEAQLTAVKDRLDQARGKFSIPVVSLFIFCVLMRIPSLHSSKSCRHIVSQLRSYCEATAGRWRCAHCRGSYAYLWWPVSEPAFEATERRRVSLRLFISVTSWTYDRSFVVSALASGHLGSSTHDHERSLLPMSEDVSCPRRSL